MKLSIKKISEILFFVMFIYSGFDKILYFTKKWTTLGNKMKNMFNIVVPTSILQVAITIVILLEIIGSLIILFEKPKHTVKMTYILFLSFLVIVTIMYHPPKINKMIPFLSNLTTFSGLLYMYDNY